MGLDQYAWALEQRPEKDTDFELDVITDYGDDFPGCFREDEVYGYVFVTKSGYKLVAKWRKHPDLHGFIREIYTRKGGSKFKWNEFRGPVVLDGDDIEAIEHVTREKTLPRTTGFFFGESQPEIDDPLTLEFCKRALVEIERGWTVVYDSSW